MKRKTLFFLLGLLFIVPLSLRAYDFKSGDLYYNITGRTVPYTVEVIGGSGLTMAVIPETVTYNDTTYSVTSIGSGAFYKCTGLTSITIPESVTSIGGSAFSNCSGLTSVTIPSSVTSIEDYTFKKCTSLTSVTIPESVTSIGMEAFYDCSALTSIIIPESVTSIGEWAFESVPNIVYHGTATGAPWRARNMNKYVDGYLVFENEAKIHLCACSSAAAGDFIIPESVTSIGGSAFDGCSGLTSITIPNSVTSIGNGAFSDCTGLTSITIPNSVMSIGKEAFWSCRNLTSVTISNSVNSIGRRTFYGCSSLTLISIPNSVTSIGYGAFEGCTGLTSITIPESVTSIGEWAFSSCTGLTSITIPSSVTSIGNNAFLDCTGITSITIPNSVTSIGNGAFCNCSGLTSITIPSSVTNIGYGAFEGCSGIQYIISLNPTPLSLSLSYTKEHPLFGSINTHNINLFVPASSIETYKAAPYWNEFNIEPTFFSWMTTTTQTTAQIDITCLPTEKSNAEYRRLGYAFKGDTIWNEQLSDSISFSLTNLTPATAYEISLISDSISTEGANERVVATYSFTTKKISMSLIYGVTTQTTLSLQFAYDFGDADIDIEGNLGEVKSFRFHPTFSTGTIDTTFTHLHPGTEYTISARAILTSGVSCGSISGTYTTLPVSLGTPNVSEYGQTYATINCDYNCGDATVLRNVLEFKLSTEDDAVISTTASVSGAQTKVTNLLPDTTYYFRHVLEAEGVGLLVSPIRTNVYTFESTEDNAHWHFINETQSNKWVIGTAAGSNRTGSKALYVSSGTSYSYTNMTSTVWAYCDEILEGIATISFDWKGTGESSYDYMYVYLVPVGSSQPTAGSTTIPTGAIQIGSRFNGQSSWTTFTDQERTLTGQYRLYFMWHNDDDTNRSPIAIDNVVIEISSNLGWQEFTTKPITLTTQEADGISNTSALLHGTVDCDQESYTEIGFEWKRSDAPATVKPQRLLVTDRVDENLLFRLEGLSSDRYYDFRTFCSYQGETYYGEWVGLLTSDKEVLVAPTVQTVGATANEQGAEMEDFIVTGTEPILQKGFEVWIKGGTDVKTTVAEGRIIHALIPEPWSYTTYQYKAYAKTASGTTYGETMEITTGYIPRDVQDIAVTPSSNSAEVTWTEIEVADYYILTLFADEAMTDTLAVYQVGTDGSISRLRMPSAVKALVTCSINDLLPDTDYYFAVVAYNGAGQKVAEESGTFATEPDPTDIRQTTDEPSPAVRKILYRGQILILRGDKVYTLTGQEIR